MACVMARREKSLEQLRFSSVKSQKAIMKCGIMDSLGLFWSWNAFEAHRHDALLLFFIFGCRILTAPWTRSFVCLCCFAIDFDCLWSAFHVDSSLHSWTQWDSLSIVAIFSPCFPWKFAGIKTTKFRLRSDLKISKLCLHKTFFSLFARVS